MFAEIALGGSIAVGRLRLKPDDYIALGEKFFLLLAERNDAGGFTRGGNLRLCQRRRNIARWARCQPVLVLEVSAPVSRQSVGREALARCRWLDSLPSSVAYPAEGSRIDIIRLMLQAVLNPNRCLFQFHTTTDAFGQLQA
jgi:hypothetical protein